mgnify:CR=1 FL=1
MITTSHVTVTNTATLVASGPGTVYLQRQVGVMMIGDNSVTEATGYNVPDNLAITLKGNDKIYSITVPACAERTGILQVLVLS